MIAGMTETPANSEPTIAAEIFARGAEKLAVGDHAGALADFDQALLLDHADSRWFYSRARCLYELERYDAAIADYDQFLEAEPADHQAREERGICFYNVGDYYEALQDFEFALPYNAAEPWFWHYRAFAYQGDGEFDLAVANFDRLLQLTPDAEAWFGRGTALHYAERHLEAISDLTRAIELKPNRAESWMWRGHSRLCLEQHALAIEDFSRAIELDPQLKNAYRGRAQAHRALGKQTAAAEEARANELVGPTDDEETPMPEVKQTTHLLLQRHFSPTPFDQLVITERTFPLRVRADLQRAMDGLMAEFELLNFCGVRKRYSHEEINFSEMLIRTRDESVYCVPPEYEEINIGEAEPIRCLKRGLWLLQSGKTKFSVLQEADSQYSRDQKLRVQIAAPLGAEGAQVVQQFFKRLEKNVFESHCYRGKILSLDVRQDYMGVATGINVHKLHSVEREQVILPRTTLELLERNVIRFVQQRSRLATSGLATKKGLLFYGPPGTGKTHTIHYLAGALTGHTTLLISAEQVGLLAEYMTLARLLQPSIVVIEDADLIGRDRRSMGSPCEEALLNRLLNEMDGLQPDANILFILTTNRPETMEAALASRPGRIDQAIEFPLPDADGRRKLIKLYACGAQISDEVIEEAVKKTEKVSASFIKELLRRAMQFHLERSEDNTIELADLDASLEEMLFTGGSLNRMILGAMAE